MLKFANTVSPPPSPQISHFGGDGKKMFGADAPTSSPQTSDQVSSNDIHDNTFACKTSTLNYSEAQKTN